MIRYSDCDMVMRLPSSQHLISNLDKMVPWLMSMRSLASKMVWIGVLDA